MKFIIGYFLIGYILIGIIITLLNWKKYRESLNVNDIRIIFRNIILIISPKEMDFEFFMVMTIIWPTMLHNYLKEWKSKLKNKE